MPWLRFDDRVRTHPKIVRAGPDAAWFWFCGVCYCREHLTDGFIPTGMIASLCPGVKPHYGTELAKRLIAAKLWRKAKQGYQVHDFLDWNPSRADVLAKRQADLDRKKKGITTDLVEGFRTDSKKIPDGKKMDSERLRARAPAGSGSGLGSGNGTDPEKSARETDGQPLILSPARFAKLQRSHAFVGSRVRVPYVLHDELCAKLGGDNANKILLDWYGQINVEVDASGEAILDIFEWLRPRFKSWAADQIFDAECERFRPKGA